MFSEVKVLQPMVEVKKSLSCPTSPDHRYGEVERLRSRMSNGLCGCVDPVPIPISPVQSVSLLPRCGHPDLVFVV